ncbi:MAG: magnesium-translocating P-type ATPase [Candidatus Absconditabacterales bacterium]
MSKNQNKISLKDMYTKFHATAGGLSTNEAEKRIKIYGYNDVQKAKKINGILKFLSYFKAPLIIILLVCAIISGFTGQYKNSVIIVLMIFLSVILNYYQETKSDKAVQEILKKLEIKSMVLRDGQEKLIATKHIVPGDIVLLSAGDIIPADGILIQADDLFVNESSLTGESFPVEKLLTDEGPVDLVFSGTNVVSGFAKFLVTGTGIQTEYGKIAQQLIRPLPSTAFEIGTKKFGYLIIKAIVFIVAVIFLINAINHKDILESIIFSLAVAVGITPELLPVIMSINMAKGSVKMAAKGAIVKRLNAIPDFGSMDILCTDKTGTLTEDKITLVKFIDVFGEINQEVLKLGYINGYFETGIRSILDDAILSYQHIDVKDIKKLDELPYDFFRKRSSIMYQRQGDGKKMVSKGAPEEMFKICTTYSIGGEIKLVNDEFIKKVTSVYDDLSSQGFRVLAIATKKLDNKEIRDIKHEEQNMLLVGMLAFYDPPKRDVKEALIAMKNHGIKIKILTGDSPLVTKKICEELDIPIEGIMSGEDLDLNVLEDDELAIKVMETNIFARLSPSQKDRIIFVLRKKGFVVGYLGDGINDAPSLKSADVGISVSNAIDVAKEAADIILVQKGLKELLEGVIEGRKTFGNTMKYMMMGLSSNFGNMFSMIGAVMFLPFFPMLPSQILLNNFLYDLSQVSLPTDHVDEEYIKKPKHRNIKFIRNFMLAFGPISSIFDFLTFYFLFAVFHFKDSMFQTGWFIESLATQIFVIYVIRTRRIPFWKSGPSKWLLTTTFGMVFLGFIFTLPFLAPIFGFAFMPTYAYLTIIGLVLIYLVLVEIVKYFFYKRMYKSSDS